MRYLRLLFLMISIGVGMALIAQPVDVTIRYDDAPRPQQPQIIPYRFSYALKIADFQAKPNGKPDEVAITNAGFGYNLGYQQKGNQHKLMILVHCEFDRSKSWMRAEQANAYYLSHEQRHFDIAFLATQRFMASLRDARFTADNYGELVEQLYNQAVAWMRQMQTDYDAKTNHGIWKDKQAIAEREIDQLLEPYRSKPAR